MTEEKRFARSQKFNISDQMWSIQAEEQGLSPADIFCVDPDRADPEPMVSETRERRGVFGLSWLVFERLSSPSISFS